MLPYTINLTPSAIDDIQSAVDYYNSRSANLGFRFYDEVDFSLQDIANMPATYGYRY